MEFTGWKNEIMIPMVYNHRIENKYTKKKKKTKQAKVKSDRVLRFGG